MGIGSNRLPRPATDPNNSMPAPVTDPSSSSSTLPYYPDPSSTPIANDTGIFSPLTNWWKNFRRDLTLARERRARLNAMIENIERESRKKPASEFKSEHLRDIIERALKNDADVTARASSVIGTRKRGVRMSNPTSSGSNVV